MIRGNPKGWNDQLLRNMCDRIAYEHYNSSEFHPWRWNLVLSWGNKTVIKTGSCYPDLCQICMGYGNKYFKLQYSTPRKLSQDCVTAFFFDAIPPWYPSHVRLSQCGPRTRRTKIWNPYHAIPNAAPARQPMFTKTLVPTCPHYLSDMILEKKVCLSAIQPPFRC